MGVVELGGRRFEVIDFDRRTVLNDVYLRKLIRATGADRVMPMDGEGDDAYIVRLQVCLVDSLKGHEIAAGMLKREGGDESEFTLEQAREFAKHLASCNTPEDRAVVQQLMMKATLDFFREGLSSLRPFLDALSAARTATPSALNETPVSPA